jgi:hypothetical protein
MYGNRAYSSYSSLHIPAKIRVNVWAEIVDDYVIGLCVIDNGLGGGHLADSIEQTLPPCWRMSSYMCAIACGFRTMMLLPIWHVGITTLYEQMGLAWKSDLLSSTFS